MYDDAESFLSTGMVKVLNAFGVPENTIKQLQFESFKKRKKAAPSGSTTVPRVGNDTTQHLILPKTFYRLIQDEDDIWSKIAQEYLLSRSIDIDDYKFYLSKGTNKQDRKWDKRLIIPIYRNNQLVFFQGRDLTDTLDPKYLSTESVSKGSILYGFDRLFTDVDQPLFVVEGFFDAIHIEGVAVFGNEMTQQQILYLNSSPRKKVVIPDRTGDGGLLAMQGLNQGWSVSVLPFNECKDVNDAIVRYGKLFVIKTLIDNIVSGFEATVRVDLLCEKGIKLKKFKNKVTNVKNK
jgi:hypothetical protein